mgnify:CR=1 FL=1
MNIFYDHQIFSLQSFGGASRLFAELAYVINRDTDHHAYIGALASNNAYLHEKNLGIPRFLEKLPVPKKAGLLYALNHNFDKIALRTRRYQIFHPTHYDASLLKYVKAKPVVVTFLDMIHERFLNRYPELQKYKTTIDEKKDIVYKASHLIAISESTKRDMVEFYDIDPSKVSVVHLGSSFDHSVAGMPYFDRPYLLYVGNRGLYKNFHLMLKAIADLLIRNKLWLVCAGGKKFERDELELFAQLGVSDLVKHETVDDRKLATLYTHALAFVFPSLYEGFGIPILESFACGCPCVTSNVSSLPEVGGNACLYMDAEQEDSIKEAIERIINDEVLRKTLANKGHKRLQEFSWERQAKETLKVYDQLL